jgi:hypothetical protein
MSHFATALVEVHNRSSKPIGVRYDGETIEIPGRGMVHMTPAAAKKAIEQNRIMGTEDPYSPQSFETLVFVVGKGFKAMPSDPIEQSEKIEALNREELPPEAQNVNMNTFRSVRPVRPSMGETLAVTRDDNRHPSELIPQ